MPVRRPASAHDLLVSAWRFAESAVQRRYEAITSGNVPPPGRPRRAAAGALMMLSRAAAGDPHAARAAQLRDHAARDPPGAGPDLQAFSRRIVALACDGTPVDARDRLVVVPTRAAAAHLIRTIEDRLLAARGAVLLPDIVHATRAARALAERLPLRVRQDDWRAGRDAPAAPLLLTEAEREVLLGVACRAARDAGVDRRSACGRAGRGDPPLLRHAAPVPEGRRHVRAARARRCSSRAPRTTAAPSGWSGRRASWWPRSAISSSAPRSTGWTNTRCARSLLIDAGRAAVPPRRPDGRRSRVRSARPASRRLGPAVALPGLERLDVVVTDTTLAGALHERMHQLLPGIEEVRFERRADADVALRRWSIPPGGGLAHVARDREEEVAGFARRVKHAVAHAAGVAPRSRGARRAPAAAVCVRGARGASVRRRSVPDVRRAAAGRRAVRGGARPGVLRRERRLRARAGDRAAAVAALSRGSATASAQPWTRRPRRSTALDRALARPATWAMPRARAPDRRLARRRRRGAARPHARCAPAMRPARARSPARAAAAGAGRRASAALMRAFSTHTSACPAADDPLRARHLRARGAILGRWRPCATPTRASTRRRSTSTRWRRWSGAGSRGRRSRRAPATPACTSSTPRARGSATSTTCSWPGWSTASGRSGRAATSSTRRRCCAISAGRGSRSRSTAARAAFADLLRLPARAARRLDLHARGRRARQPVAAARRARGVRPATPSRTDAGAPHLRARGAGARSGATPDARSAASATGPARRIAAPRTTTALPRHDRRPHAAPAYSLSALERYQDCPFKFFAADVLRLEETPEDESALSPRARGRFIHEVFQRFFEAWDAGGHGADHADRHRRGARSCLRAVAEPLLAAAARCRRGARAHAAVRLGDLGRHRRRRARPRGVAAGDGHASAGSSIGSRASSRSAMPAAAASRCKGVADRIDLLAGRRLRVIDYKSGSAPNAKRALQVPIYALCAQERLTERDGAPWASTRRRTSRSPASGRWCRSSRPARRLAATSLDGRARPAVRASSTASSAASFRRGRTTR